MYVLVCNVNAWKHPMCRRLKVRPRARSDNYLYHVVICPVRDVPVWCDTSSKEDAMEYDGKLKVDVIVTYYTGTNKQSFTGALTPDPVTQDEAEVITGIVGPPALDALRELVESYPVPDSIHSFSKRRLT